MTFGGGIGLGLLLVVISAAVFLIADCGSLEFWPDALLFGLLGTAFSMVFVLPGYLLLAGITILILRKTNASRLARRRWLLWLPTLCVLFVAGHLLNQLRPSVGFRSATGTKAPNSLRRCHYAHGQGLMWSRHVAWFEAAPADLKTLVQAKELTLTNGVSLLSVLNDDRWINRSSLPSKVPSSDLSVCYVNLWQELNFSTERYLFTTPEHDRAVWIYRHDR